MIKKRNALRRAASRAAVIELPRIKPHKVDQHLSVRAPENCSASRIGDWQTAGAQTLRRPIEPCLADPTRR